MREARNQRDGEGRQYRCVIEPGQGAFEQLRKVCGLPSTALRDAIGKGAVWVQRANAAGELRKPVRIHLLPDELAHGDALLLNYNAAILGACAANPTLISDQVNYSIWHKPAGVFSQASKWADHCSIVRQVTLLHGKSSHLVHRLDRAASGLIVIAHTRNAQVRLASMFEQRRIEKHYQVTVEGTFAHPLPFDIRLPVDGKAAHSSVLTCRLRPSENLSDLVIRITTGRKHQIRRHLAASGFPIQGDRLYGNAAACVVDLQLTASRLEFRCPFTDQLLTFERESSESVNA